MTTIILPLIGAGITLAFALWAIIQPNQFSRIISLTPYKAAGITEVRATYGGFVGGLAVFALWSQADVAFLCLAFGWFGAALARFFGSLIDHSFSRRTLSFIAIEVVVGFLLLLGMGF